MRKYPIDMHTHTLVSGHAYSTMREMTQIAIQKGMTALGITEHAPNMPGTCHDFYFHNLKVVDRDAYGIELCLGTELNIMDYEGNIDMKKEDLATMDVVIASLHRPCIKSGTKEENTQAYLGVMKNPYVNIIGHPDDSRYPVDYEQLVEGAKKAGILLEVNNHSISPKSMRMGARENNLELLRLCKEYEQPIILDSDAHVDTLIGEFDYALPILEEANFPDELVMNTDFEKLKPYINKYKLK